MEKKARTYRLSEDILQELQEIASKLSISETEAISCAVHLYYLAMKGEERGTVTGSIISFSEYQKIQDRFASFI